jgi:hypothetical protein
MKDRLHSDSSTSHEQQAHALAHSGTFGETRSFQSAEEVLHMDRQQVEVPGRVAERLAESIAQDASARSPWWRRLLGRGR